jgi:hypothetical protein
MCVCVTSKHRLSRLSCYSNVHTPSNFPLLLVTSLSPPHFQRSRRQHFVLCRNLIRLKTRRERSVRGRPRSVRALTGSPAHDEAKAESAKVEHPNRSTIPFPHRLPGRSIRLALSVRYHWICDSCSVYLAAVYETAPWGTNSVLLRKHVVPYLETSRHRACAQRAYTLAL